MMLILSTGVYDGINVLAFGARQSQVYLRHTESAAPIYVLANRYHRCESPRLLPLFPAKCSVFHSVRLLVLGIRLLSTATK